jgi:hypothetical protein
MNAHRLDFDNKADFVWNQRLGAVLTAGGYCSGKSAVPGAVLIWRFK